MLPFLSTRNACGLMAMFGLNTRSTLVPAASYSIISICALRLKTSRCPSGVKATEATLPNFCPRGGTGRAPKWNGSIGTPAGGAVAAVGAGILAGSGPKSPGVGLGFCPLTEVDTHTDSSRRIAGLFMVGKRLPRSTSLFRVDPFLDIVRALAGTELDNPEVGEAVLVERIFFDDGLDELSTFTDRD